MKKTMRGKKTEDCRILSSVRKRDLCLFQGCSCAQCGDKSIQRLVSKVLHKEKRESASLGVQTKKKKNMKKKKERSTQEKGLTQFRFKNPGIWPRLARRRRLCRLNRVFEKTPRPRPVSVHRFRTRVAEVLRSREAR